jgi:hypothetical protein
LALWLRRTLPLRRVSSNDAIIAHCPREHFCRKCDVGARCLAIRIEPDLCGGAQSGEFGELEAVEETPDAAERAVVLATVKDAARR